MFKVFGAGLLLAIVVMPVAALAGVRTVKLAVPGMTCVSCLYIIEHSISAIKGVTDVKASFADRTATVTYDDAVTSLDAITKASGDVGFAATVIETGGKS
jgi:periplasmic mercuric ion binding protein